MDCYESANFDEIEFNVVYEIVEDIIAKAEDNYFCGRDGRWWRHRTDDVRWWRLYAELPPIIQDVPDCDVLGFEEVKVDSAKGPKIKSSSGNRQEERASVSDVLRVLSPKHIITSPKTVTYITD